MTIRVIIEPEAEKYNATLVKREDDNDSLARFWVRPDGDACPTSSPAST